MVEKMIQQGQKIGQEGREVGGVQKPHPMYALVRIDWDRYIQV